MSNFKCRYDAIDIDIYRKACLASYAYCNRQIVLHSRHHYSDLPAGVSLQVDNLNSRKITLDEIILPSNKYRLIHRQWAPIDIFQLQEFLLLKAPETPALFWGESFKLWLPEYTDEIRKRSKSWSSLPFNLNMAEIAGISLQRLPPPQSFLSELIYSIPEVIPTPPIPHYSASEVRRLFQVFLRSNEWLLVPLMKECGQEVIRSLGINTNASLHTKAYQTCKHTFGHWKRKAVSLFTR